MKRTIVALFAVLAAFAIYAINQAYNYTYRILGIRLKSIGNNNVSASIEIAIFNPSPISAAVTAYQFDMYINGIYTTTVYGNGPYHLRENSETPIDINFSLQNIPNLAALIGPSILINKETLIRFSGPVEINMFGITKSINIDIEKPLSWYLQ